MRISAAVQTEPAVRTPRPADDFATVLRFCTRSNDLPRGRLIHDSIIRNSSEHEAHLRFLLLQLYGQCAALQDASVILQADCHRHDSNSWNSVVRAYARHGSFAETMRFFGSMCRERISLDKLVIVSILSSAASHGALQEGRLLHSFVEEGAFNDDVFVGTALINMHGKCGSLIDARFMFDKLQNRDTIAWNAIISIYGQNEEQKLTARIIFEQMLQEGFLTDSATIVNVLSSCSQRGDLLEGKKFHLLVKEKGLDEELLVATAILTMYGKCGDLQNMRRIFDRFRKHDVVSWNTMIGSYSVNGQKNEALRSLEQMQNEGLKPDKVTFLSILEAFSGEEALIEGKNMHLWIARNGLELDVVTGTSLINMYGRCGSPKDAWILFDKMPVKNTLTWNSMIAAFVQNAEGARAIQLSKNMLEKGLKPDRCTVLSIVKSCATEYEIKDICASFLITGIELDDALRCALINLYSNCGSLPMAWDVFNQGSQESVAISNAMLAAFAQNEESKRALQLYKQMQLQGVLPDKDSYVHVLDAFEDERALPCAKQVHACIRVVNLESDNIIGTALVNMYIRCSGIKEALTWFETTRAQDVVSWTSLISACCQQEKFSEALELFECMHDNGLQPDRVAFVCILSACGSPGTLSYGKCLHMHVVHSGQDTNVSVANALFNMYLRCGCLDDSLSIFKKIQFRDSVTYVSVLSACAKWALVQEGKEIHASIMGTEIESELFVRNALIDFYGRSGLLKEAELMFSKTEQRDIVTWTVMVAAYAHQGKGRVVLNAFEKMINAGNQPNEVTFVSVLSACCHDGLVYEACHHVLSMKLVYGFLPLVHHYDCLIDLFARAGRLEEAENLVNSMPFLATVVSWTSLLSACKSQADIQRGEFAAEQASHLDPENYTPYLILRSIYSAAGNADDSLVLKF